MKLMGQRRNIRMRIFSCQFFDRNIFQFIVCEAKLVFGCGQELLDLFHAFDGLIDITHFEEDLDAFKQAFAKNYNSASTNFGKAIDEIDKAIKRMEEVKKFLTTSENQLRLANNKLEDVSVKKLTRKNPTMKAKFEALKGE